MRLVACNDNRPDIIFLKYTNQRKTFIEAVQVLICITTLKKNPSSHDMLNDPSLRIKLENFDEE